ncbi:MAG: DUF1385 domain-containing protein [Candidatus Woesearchaeota archaeon]
MGENVGGLAVVEGVMMRKGTKMCTAVRKPDGKIVLRKQEYESITKKNKLFRLPIIRGAINFFEFLIVSIKETVWSSNQSLEEDEQLGIKEMILMVLLSFLLALGLFKLLPWFIASITLEGNLAVNLFDAFIKTSIFILYLVLLGKLNDTKMLFEYHGAEHKTINCYEKNLKLTVNNVKKQTLLNPRCGTTFIVLVFLVSIFFYVLIPVQFGFWLNFLFRIMLLPIIAGFGYELLHLGNRFYHKKIIRTMMQPGLWFQKLTTREPNKKQIEVAIKAIKQVISNDKAQT